MRRGRPLAPCFLAAVALGAACAPVEGPVTVEALIHDPESENGSRLGDVELETVTDLGRAEGTLFSVRGGLRMAGFSVIESARAGDSYDDMVETCRGSAGNTFDARMTFDGTRWVAQDLETLTAFTLFAALEKAYARAEASGDEFSSAPGALVGVTAEYVAADVFPLPLLTSDNAAYAPAIDSWLTLRVALQGGVPFAMSLPVLSHEFGHRFFFQNVFRSDDAFEVWRSRITNENPSVAEARGNRLMQGVDEGIADILSLSVTGDLDGVSRAFRQAGGVFASEGDDRDLEGDFATAASYDGLNDLTIDSAFLQACGAAGDDPLFEQAEFNFYCIGTVLARALWDGSDRSVEVLREETMPAIVVALRALGERLPQEPTFDVEFLLEPLAAEVSPTRRDVLCSAFRDKFASVVTAGRVPSCPP